MLTTEFSFPLSENVILPKRAAILTALCSCDNGFASIPASHITPDTLEILLSLYDTHFLSGYIGRHYKKLRVTLSSRLISTAGKFIYTKDAFGRLKDAEIRMSSDFLTRLGKGPFLLNGLSVATAQEAFLVVFEHELCHALEIILFGSTGHSDRFLMLAKGLFGHTGTRHSLPTRRTEAANDGLYVGSTVSFSYQGKCLTGIVTYIGKSVTVMVASPQGAYRDRYGRRYDKYRTMISALQPHK